LELLDEFGHLAAERQPMAQAYEAFRDAAARLAEVTANSDAVRQRLELLRFQVKELRDAGLTRGEEAALQHEREVQRHAENLSVTGGQSEAGLCPAAPPTPAGPPRVGQQLHEAARIDETFRAAAETLSHAAAQAEEVARDLRRAADRIRHDPERL